MSVAQRAGSTLASRLVLPVNWPPATLAFSPCSFSTPPCNSTWVCKSFNGAKDALAKSSSAIATCTSASIARSEGKSKRRCGNTLPPGAAGAEEAPAGAAPTEGPKSASARRVPPKRPLRRAGVVRVSKRKSPFSWLRPTVARSACRRHTPLSCAMAPRSSNGGVCGSVIFSGAPAWASDGPLRRNCPCSRRSPRSALAVPSKKTFAAPAVPSTRSVPGSPLLSMSCSRGSALPVRNCRFIGSAFQRPVTVAR